MGYQTGRDMAIAITGGGFVVALQAIIESLFGYSSDHQRQIIIQEYAGVAIVLFGLGYAILVAKQKNQPNHEQTWEENQRSIVNFILSAFDDDFNAMQPIFEKLESRRFDFKNECEIVALEDVKQINPNTFRERFDKLPLIQNVLGFITFEQYSALYNYLKYSSLFIDSLCKQNYRKDLVELRGYEAKKIVEFFPNEEKNHVGLTEWKKRLLQTD